jgi:hypothetical protein
MTTKLPEASGLYSAPGYEKTKGSGSSLSAMGVRHF